MIFKANFYHKVFIQFAYHDDGGGVVDYPNFDCNLGCLDPDLPVSRVPDPFSTCNPRFGLDFGRDRHHRAVDHLLSFFLSVFMDYLSLRDRAPKKVKWLTFVTVNAPKLDSLVLVVFYSKENQRERKWAAIREIIKPIHQFFSPLGKLSISFYFFKYN